MYLLIYPILTSSSQMNVPLILAVCKVKTTIVTVVSLDAFDVDLVVSTLTKLKEGGRVEVPVYDFATHSRAKYTVSVCGLWSFREYMYST